jgi:hypothetical protein
MNKMISSFAMLILLAAAGAQAEVKFLPLKPGVTGYQALPDLASVEAMAPLSPADRAAIKATDLKNYTQEQLDQLYARLTSGPIPVGDYHGTVLAKHPLITMVSNIALKKATAMGLTGFITKAALNGICGSESKDECLAEFLWSGKRFYAPNEYGEIQLRNAVSPVLQNPLLLKKAGLGMMSAPLSQFPLQVFNRSPRLMMFPAEVYCGVSLYDTRRESIIIDYAYGDDFKPFIPEVDGLVGRNGSWIRDEIRMVRPGLYLGRAYVDRVFLVNFVLENLATESQIANDGTAAKPDGGFLAGITGLFGKKSNPVDADKAWGSSCWNSNSWQ